MRSNNLYDKYFKINENTEQQQQGQQPPAMNNQVKNSLLKILAACASGDTSQAGNIQKALITYRSQFEPLIQNEIDYESFFQALGLDSSALNQQDQNANNQQSGQQGGQQGGQPAQKTGTEGTAQQGLMTPDVQKNVKADILKKLSDPSINADFANANPADKKAILMQIMNEL